MAASPSTADIQGANARVQSYLLGRWFPHWEKDLPPVGTEERHVIEAAALKSWMFEACRTRDEHDYDNPIKPLPRLNYIELICDLLVRERVVLLAKSRQISATWTIFEYGLWRAVGWPFRSIALVPKKGEDGRGHIKKRINQTLWHYLPEWLTSMYNRAQIEGYFELREREGKQWSSYIVPFPKGADQLRQDTHSVIIWDEMAHQDSRESWKGAIPTIQARNGKGGQLIGLSSARRGSHFEELLGPQLYHACRVARGEAEPAVQEAA